LSIFQTEGLLFVKGADDDATKCVFSRGCYEVNGTAVNVVCGGLSHLRKYDFINIVKTNITLRFKESIISISFTLIVGGEIHWKTPTVHHHVLK
jgi:hypothetical protein